MEFFNVWKAQIDRLLEFVLVAIIGGILMACFSPKVQIRYLFGSVIAGASAGAIGSAMFPDSPAVAIGATILGVLTAPVTIARLSGMTIWEALDTLRARTDKPE